MHLATDNALELFAQIDEQEYLGYSHANGTLGRKGYDASVLEGYEVVDDPRPTKSMELTVVSDDDDDEAVCLHEDIEPFEEEATRGACSDCGAEFELPSSAAKSEADVQPVA